MRPTNITNVLAICCSDVHLSLRPPIARAEEPNWLEAQARPWEEIKELVKHSGAPVIVAGDLFDRWNPPVELVNWALDTLPPLLGIPGNHDLPSHRHEGQHRSAWGTLVRAGRITELTPDGFMPVEGWREIKKNSGSVTFYGFPFGTKVTPPKKSKNRTIAVIHEFMWTCVENGFHGVSKKLQLRKKDKRFKGYDFVIVGDNHISFEQELKNGTTVINCGTLLRRKSNEAGYHPRVALLTKEGVVNHELDTTLDIITQIEASPESYDPSGINKFIEDLAGLQSSCLNYRDTLIAALEHRDTPGAVRKLIMEALDA